MSITYKKAIEDIFNAINIKYQRINTEDEEKYLYKCSVELAEKERVLKNIDVFNFAFGIDLLDCSIIMVSSKIYTASNECRLELLELVNHLNRDTIYGTYIIDDNNEIRYYISSGITSKCEELSEKLINNYIDNLVMSVNKIIQKIVDTLREKKERQNE